MLRRALNSVSPIVVHWGKKQQKRMTGSFYHQEIIALQFSKAVSAIRKSVALFDRLILTNERISIELLVSKTVERSAAIQR
ncbi:hypothetical protein NECAME_12010 [Necator americanus]|uniref:Uncharacterized protein n=1 Tax=Necator americanus TaxID=51031 RepID=W2T1U1_NECAM|nr:hypothetical protein NECAME_12010 [Necator americanus]ETN75965.1 hypothetical protein NECAME_12010 [Necator americanus]